MKGVRYVLFCMVLCAIYCFPAYADDWEIWVPDVEEDTTADTISYQFDSTSYATEEYVDEWEDDTAYDIPIIDDREIATISNARVATISNATTINIQPAANYSAPYDGSMSTTYVQFAKDVVSKLSPKYNYVFFRSGQYTYRLVYAEDLTLTGTVFTATSASYVSWTTSNYTIAYGSEGDFRLTAGSYQVYTDLPGHYPTLDSGVRNFEFKTLLLLVATLLLFNIVHAFFFVGKFRI